MGKKWKQWQILFSWAPKPLLTVTAAMKLKDACSLEKKQWHLDSVLKSRDITLLTKICKAKVMFFPVGMHRCESWTIKKAECWRIYAFKSWHWRRHLRAPWTARRANQSILKKIIPEYSLEGLMLKLQYFGHLMWQADLLEKTLMLGKIEAKRRRELQRMRQLDGITDSADVNLSKFQQIAEDRGVWQAAVHGVAKSWTWLSDWTTTINMVQISTVPKSLMIYLKIKHTLQGNIFMKHFSDCKKSKISWNMETKRQWLQYLQSWTVFWF